MYCIPKLKKITVGEGVLCAENILWQFSEGIDKRVRDAAFRVCESRENGIPVKISHGSSLDEGYEITVEKEGVTVTASGAAGAFYAVSTLKILLKYGNGRLECCNIKDSPDMKIRGFYQDTTRGRIPTLESLKKLVDTMADYKLNMLQLYVEHSFDFKEYDFCKKRLGYLTAEELRALDLYCKERFVRLVPSLSTFGHLYHLLESDKYKHLREIREYEPKPHYFWDRMKHHTINPCLSESFELVSSLIEQHMAAFTDEYFNICCDETFDLGTDVNRGKDKEQLYVTFVEKLVKYVESRGKKVMMWADIVLEHKESADKLPPDVIYLNWDYSPEPLEKNIAALAGKKQIVCPGTWSWIGFSERVKEEKSNILNMAKLGYKYGSLGLLNTNWGDMGNLSSIDMAMYGLILGAAISWNKDTCADDEYNSFVSEYHYGNENAVDILMFFSEILPLSNWTQLMANRLRHENTAALYKEKTEMCSKLIKSIESSSFSTDSLKKNFLITAQGYAFLMKWCAAKQGFSVKCGVNFDKWLDDYSENYLSESKQGELDELKKLFIKFNCESDI